MPLVAFSTGTASDGAPVNPQECTTPWRDSIALNGLTGDHIRASYHILFPCLLFQLEFPTLLAKREIIANALCFFQRCHFLDKAQAHIQM